MPRINLALFVCSGGTLIFISSVFGFMGMPTEMGLSILAGALGLAFSNIENIAEFSGAGFSAKMKSQIQAVIDKETEQEIPEKSEAIKPVSNTENIVLNALQNQKYTWRTLRGICTDSQMSESEVWATLVLLKQKGLVRTTNTNKTGEMIWSLTREGHAYANKAA